MKKKEKEREGSRCCLPEVDRRRKESNRLRFARNDEGAREERGEGSEGGDEGGGWRRMRLAHVDIHGRGLAQPTWALIQPAQ